MIPGHIAAKGAGRVQASFGDTTDLNEMNTGKVGTYVQTSNLTPTNTVDAQAKEVFEMFQMPQWAQKALAPVASEVSDGLIAAGMNKDDADEWGAYIASAGGVAMSAELLTLGKNAFTGNRKHNIDKKTGNKKFKSQDKKDKTDYVTDDNNQLYKSEGDKLAPVLNAEDKAVYAEANEKDWSDAKTYTKDEQGRKVEYDGLDIKPDSSLKKGPISTSVRGIAGAVSKVNSQIKSASKPFDDKADEPTKSGDELFDDFSDERDETGKHENIDEETQNKSFNSKSKDIVAKKEDVDKRLSATQNTQRALMDEFKNLGEDATPEEKKTLQDKITKNGELLKSLGDERKYLDSPQAKIDIAQNKVDAIKNTPAKEMVQNALTDELQQKFDKIPESRVRCSQITPKNSFFSYFDEI